MADIIRTGRTINLPEDHIDDSKYWDDPRWAEVKKAVTGKLNAGKEEIQNAIRKLYPKAKLSAAKNSFEHIADSCAAYLAARSSNVVRMFG
jgi:Holliday junction resolvasome RuvABC endonuclease subunit